LRALHAIEHAAGVGKPSLLIPRSSFTLAPLVPAFGRPGDW
jgi:hypothetical protein